MPGKAQESKSRVLQAAKEHDIKFVSLWFTDALGFLKGFTITVEELEAALEDVFWFGLLRDLDWPSLRPVAGRCYEALWQFNEQQARARAERSATAAAANPETPEEATYRQATEEEKEAEIPPENDQNVQVPGPGELPASVGQRR